MTANELQDIADNLDLNDSDIDDDLVNRIDSDDDHEDLIVQNIEEQEEDILPPVDDWDSSDDEPLARLVPQSARKWIRGKQFAPQKHLLAVNQSSEVMDPFQYFQKYIGEDFFKDVAMFSNMREVSVTGQSLNTSAVEIGKFFGCSMLIGIYALPRFRMSWAHDTRVPIIADNITRDRFFKLRSRLKVVDDNKVSAEIKSLDRFWKVRPLLDRVQRGCLQNVRTNEVSIDEQMIPFSGQVLMRQFIRGKPNPVGLKNFVMTTPTGIPLDFYMYEGKGSSVESALTETPEKLDVGGRMVLKLTDTLPIGVSVYTDRYFTSIPLIDSLACRSLTLAGTIMANRLPKTAQLLADNKLKKKGRGSYDQLVRDDGKVNIVKWFDNKPVHFASSISGVEPEGLCKRWSKAENKRIEIKQPAIVKEYNAKMGGVDLLDRVISKYAMRNRTKKWTIRTIFHFVDFSVAAGWLEYREDAKAAGGVRKDTMDYLDFKLSIAKTLVLKTEEKDDMDVDSETEDEDPQTKRRSVQPIPDKRCRVQGNTHLVEFMKSKQKSRSKCRFPGCKNLTYARCKSCDIFLCCSVERNCFLEFHK